MSNTTDKPQDNSVHKFKLIDKGRRSEMTVVEKYFKGSVDTTEVFIPDGRVDPKTGEDLSKDEVLMRIVAAVHRATERGEQHWKAERPPLIELFRNNPSLVEMSAHRVRNRTGYGIEHIAKVRSTAEYAAVVEAHEKNL